MVMSSVGSLRRVRISSRYSGKSSMLKFRPEVAADQVRGGLGVLPGQMAAPAAGDAADVALTRDCSTFFLLMPCPALQSLELAVMRLWR